VELKKTVSRNNGFSQYVEQKEPRIFIQRLQTFLCLKNVF